MLGRAARFLRLFGFDTLYKNSYTDPELLKIAAEEKRILLTRDVALYRQAKKLDVQSVLLVEKNYINQIASLCNKLTIDLELDPLNSRCATCNAIIAPISKDEVEGRVPERTLEVFDEYWICTNEQCAKIYYQGPHWVNITKAYEEIRKKIKESLKE